MILGGFAAVILLCLLPTVFCGWAIDYSGTVLNRFIDVDEHISNLSLTSIAKMIKVRRNEKDFLLAHRDFGFNEARARYITTSLSIIADIKENMSTIRSITTDSETVRLSKEIDLAISQYQKGLVSFTELYGILGNENSGLEGQIRSVAHDIESVLKQGENNQLMLDFFSMRVSEKEYIINDLDSNFSKIKIAAKRFRADVEARIVNSERKMVLIRLIDTYMDLINRYEQIVEQLTTTRETYLRTLQGVEPMLEKLQFISTSNTHKARNGIKDVETTIKIIIICSFILVLFLSSIMAFFVLKKISKSEEKLKQSEKKYRDLFETSPDSIIIMDMDHTIVMVNLLTLNLLGQERPEEIIGRNIADTISPKDRPSVAHLLARTIEAGTFEGIEFKMMKSDGSPIDVEGVSSLVLDAQGKAEAIMLATRDITARKRAEEEAREAQEYARYLINSSLDMIITVDTNRCIVEFNKAAEDVFGYSKDEMLGKRIDLLYLDSAESSRVGQAIQETGWFSGEIVNKKKNNETFPAFLSASLIRDAEGNQSGIMGISRDITEMKKIELELKAAATLDKLTGIYNRRKLEISLEGEVNRANRYKNPLSLIIIDVDHFKKVNDTYGHLAGDSVLQTIATVVKDSIRKTDCFGRWGGEEFMILMPQTARKDAMELAEKIRQLIENHIFEKTGKTTICCGVTQFRDQDTLDGFVKRADDALYKAKNLGRNMVVEA
jgi:diguanylate cyclase (GGDEF)-like protein/PAS domain S-box-containing protein